MVEFVATEGECGMTRNEENGAWLLAEHASGADFKPFAEARGISGLEEAYSVQDAYVAAMTRSGLTEDVRGWKIGLTSKRMQAMCGIDQPVAGAILASRVLPSGTRVSRRQHGRLGLEFEICTRLGTDLPARATPWSFEEVRAAVDSVAAAIEMIDDRNADYAQLDVRSLVADNSWNAGAVLGDWAPLPADLNACEGVVHLDGVELDRGFGRDVLDGPLHVLQWLANHLRERGHGLRAGDIVMTGSLVTTRFPEPGSHYAFDLAGIGRVELHVDA